METDAVFLFSSKKEPPNHFFQGYFFHGADYVHGASGLESFSRARRRDRLSREDGCYVHAQCHDDGTFSFSVDYCGYKKLFYYWNAGFWAVSNSLHRLARHLRRHGYPLLPDTAQVAAMATEGTFYPTGRGSFFSQLTTFETIARGIRLAPADRVLRIGPRFVRLERCPVVDAGGDYQQRLERFVRTWVARFTTLLADPAVRLSCDLTGGLDSRAVFALLLTAARRAHPEAVKKPQIRAATDLAASQDLAIAARSVLRPAFDNSLVSRRTRSVSPRPARPAFEAALRRTLEAIADAAPGGLDARTTHYRHFRNRFHFGREPQYSVMFHPLASGLLDHAVAVAGAARFGKAQVHFDLMGIVPELLDVPFDSRLKHPGARTRANITRVQTEPSIIGNCFLGDGQSRRPDDPPTDPARHPLDLLRDDFRVASSGAAADLLGRSYVRRAARALDEALDDGAFTGPIRSKRVAVVMACQLFDAD